MLKFIFWTLVIGNGALFAYHQGYLDSFVPVSREPARLAQQLNADKIRLLPAGTTPPPAAAPPVPGPAVTPPAERAGEPASQGETVATAMLVAATEAPLAPAAAEKPAAGAVVVAEQQRQDDKKTDADKKPAILACTEIGNFNEADAGRFEARLAALVPDARLSRRVVRETSSYMVYMPAQGSKENADLKVEQLRSLGVTDFYVIQDQSEMRWGISLGVFSSEEAARKRLGQIREQGVRTARIGARNAISKIALQLPALDAAGRAKVEKIKADFPSQQLRKCA